LGTFLRGDWRLGFGEASTSDGIEENDSRQLASDATLPLQNLSIRKKIELPESRINMVDQFSMAYNFFNFRNSCNI
jgi:hypothetical protein